MTDEGEQKEGVELIIPTSVEVFFSSERHFWVRTNVRNTSLFCQWAESFRVLDHWSDRQRHLQTSPRTCRDSAADSSLKITEEKTLCLNWHDEASQTTGRSVNWVSEELISEQKDPIRQCVAPNFMRWIWFCSSRCFSAVSSYLFHVPGRIYY